MSEQSGEWPHSHRDSSADAALRDLIRARIRSGRLPRDQGHRLFGGKGEGTLCACCDRFITSAEIQFDIESPHAGEWVSHAMHLHCFELWRIESRASTPRRSAELAELERPAPG
jgi:hypothetical protein